MGSIINMGEMTNVYKICGYSKRRDQYEKLGVDGRVICIILDFKQQGEIYRLDSIVSSGGLLWTCNEASDSIKCGNVLNS